MPLYVNLKMQVRQMNIKFLRKNLEDIMSMFTFISF